MILNNPSAERNADAIFEVLSAQLGGQQARVLEIASGSGQHVELFARRCPEVYWQPSEPQAHLRDSIDARVAQAQLTNVAPSLALDVRENWPQRTYDLVLAINMVHISPWEATEALVKHAAGALADDGLLMLYGPYSSAGVHNSKSNIDFDADLRSRDARWGIRDTDAVAKLGAAVGLTHFREIEMPANNRTLLMSFAEVAADLGA